MRVRSGVLCAKEDYGEEMEVGYFYRIGERRCHQKEYRICHKIMVLIRSGGVFMLPSKEWKSHVVINF